MKRILFVSLYPLQDVGGGERYSLDTIRSIRMCGDECVAYAAAARLPPRQTYTDRLGTKFVKILPGAPATFGEPIEFRDLLSEVSAHDAVVIHQYLSNDLVFDFIGDVASDQPLILTNLGHEPLDQEFRACFQQTPSCWFVEISEYSAARSRKFSRQSVAISAGIWREDIEPAAGPEAFAGRLCSVGRVLPHKGIEITIKGLPPDCRLTVVGPNREDAAYARWLQSLARGRCVEFTGAIPDEKKRSVVRESDLLVASSHHRLYDNRVIPQPELLGLVIFEALALNTMPLTSSVPSFTEVMGKLELCDYVYPEDESAGLREAIERYRSTPAEEIAGRLRRGRERMQEHYLWDTFWDRIKQGIAF